MIDHVWTVICSRAVIDKESNNVSLQNVLEQFNIQAEPKPDGLLITTFDLMTLWARSEVDIPSRGRSRTTFITPSGETIGSFEVEIDLFEHERNRNRLRFNDLPAREPGRHIFRVELQNEGESEWHQVAVVPLTLVFNPPEAEETSDNLITATTN